MSKCREEFEKEMGYAPHESSVWFRIWQAAWNARGKVDAELSDKYVSEWIRYYIEQENEK